MGRLWQDPKQRFDKKFVVNDSGCWIWTAGRFDDGYGQFKLSGRGVRAHRFSWSFVNGPIPEGLQVLHKCNVPLCVNPDHLYAGTHAQNMKDRAAAGNYFKGEKNPGSKLTDRQRMEIADQARRGRPCRQIARDFNISKSLAQKIGQVR